MLANHLLHVCYLVFKDQICCAFIRRTCGGSKLYRNLFWLSSLIASLINSPGVYSSARFRSAFNRERGYNRTAMAVSSFFSLGLFLFQAKARPASNEAGLLEKFRRRPTFPHSYPCSIIGAVGLNFCVRNGNRCDSYAIATENRTTGFQLPKTLSMRAFWIETHGVGGARRTSPPFLTKKLFMVKPHGQLVPVS